MDKFHDAKQVLELRDSIPFGENQLIVTTMMLEEPKVFHSKKYWFETYVIEVSNENDSKMVFGKLGNQYLTAYEAIQGHRLTVSMLQEILVRAESKFSNKNDSEILIRTESEVGTKPKKQQKGLDKS